MEGVDSLPEESGSPAKGGRILETPSRIGGATANERPITEPALGGSEKRRIKTQRFQPSRARGNLNIVEEKRALPERDSRLRTSGELRGPRRGAVRLRRTGDSVERAGECQGKRALAESLAPRRLETETTRGFSAL